MVNHNITKLSDAMKCNLFATMSDYSLAVDRLHDVIENCPKKDRAGLYTALHVMLNSLAKEIDILND